MGWNVIQQGKTSETQYSIASYDGLVTVTGALTGSILVNPAGATAPATYTNIVPTGGTGAGAILSITVSNPTTATSITVTSPGSGYIVGDTLTVPNDALGAGSTGPTIMLTAGDLGTLIAVQPSPTTSPPTAHATTSAFNTEGDGQGVTISYDVATAAATDVKVVLDINNDPDVSDQLWVATDATHTSTTGTFFVASKNSYRQVRLRVESATLPFSITNIRLMVDS